MLNEPLQHRTAAASGVTLHGYIPTVFPRLDPCTFWTLFHHKTLFVKAGFALCERQKIFIDFIYSAYKPSGSIWLVIFGGGHALSMLTWTAFTYVSLKRKDDVFLSAKLTDKTSGKTQLCERSDKRKSKWFNFIQTFTRFPALNVSYSWLYLTEMLSEMLRTCLNGHKDRSPVKLFL